MLTPNWCKGGSFQSKVAVSGSGYQGCRSRGLQAGAWAVLAVCLLCVCVDNQLPGARECFQSKHQSPS